MNMPKYPTMPPRNPPSKELTTEDQEPVRGWNAGNFLAALRKIKERHPDLTDEAVEVHYDDGIYFAVTTTSPNHNYEADMILFLEKLEISRKEYADYLEAYKVAP